MRVRDQITKSGGGVLEMEEELHSLLRKDWSDSAREAAARERAAGSKHEEVAGARPRSLGQSWGGQSEGYKFKGFTGHDSPEGSVDRTHQELENGLTRAKGIRVTGRGTSLTGKPYVTFHDKLYDVDGKSEMLDKPIRGYDHKVSLSSKTHGTVDGPHLEGARIKMKRLYYGAKNPNQTLRNQGISVYGSRDASGKWNPGRSGVGRTAKE